jgi:hypothetical protein
MKNDPPSLKDWGDRSGEPDGRLWRSKRRTVCERQE